MRVLVACEHSGIVRNAFLRKGFDAVSCDLLSSDSPGPHIAGDIFEIIDHGWDLMIAHPPCTYLCNSGVRWLYEQKGRWQKMKEAAQFFKFLLDSSIPYIAVENPIPHKYAVEIIGRTYDQKVQPWQFGHNESKATCLWLKNLPKLKPTKVERERNQSLWRLPPSKDRWKLRSKTFEGIADAIADQWGNYVLHSST